MKQHWIKLAACLLAVLLLAGCMPSNMGQPGDTVETTSPAVTDAPEDPTGETAEGTDPVPETTPDDSLIATNPAEIQKLIALEASQQRLRGKQADWGNRFTADNGNALLVSDAQELADKLPERGIGSDETDLSGFDENFFLNNRLLVIPMRSNSGSVRYEAAAECASHSAQIMLEGKMNGEGTADMADWLVFVTLPREAFPEDMTITTTANGNLFQPGNLTDR